jgi:hypothetical protein
MQEKKIKEIDSEVVEWRGVGMMGKGDKGESLNEWSE